MDYVLHAAMPVYNPISEMDFVPDECYRDIGQEPPDAPAFDIYEDDDIQF